MSPGPQVAGQPETSVPACVSWMAFLIIIMVGKVSEWVPGLSHVPLAKIAFLLALISAYRFHGVLWSVKLGAIKIVRPALAFLALAIASIAFSIYRSASLTASEVILIILLSMIVLLKITRSIRDIERLLVGFAGASVSLSMGLILNYHGGRADINSNFDPNDIAYVLDTALPIVLALRSGQSRLGGWLLNGLSILIAVSVLLTGSRGGDIGLCVVVILVVVFPVNRGGDGLLARVSLRRTLMHAMILIGVFAAAWGTLPSTARTRMASLLDLQDDYNASSTLNSSRLVIWRRDVGAALARPIGYGLGSAEAVDGLHGGQYRAAHNSLVEVFVELGVLGLLLYLYTLSIAWKYLLRLVAAAKRSTEERIQTIALYSRALCISLAGNMAAGFFLSQAYSPALWMDVAIAAALVRIALSERNASIAGNRGRAVPGFVTGRARS